jgi:hypothetical protein
MKICTTKTPSPQMSHYAIYLHFVQDNGKPRHNTSRTIIFIKKKTKKNKKKQKKREIEIQTLLIICLETILSIFPPPRRDFKINLQPFSDLILNFCDRFHKVQTKKLYQKSSSTRNPFLSSFTNLKTHDF